jgi:hypothetical protein
MFGWWENTQQKFLIGLATVGLLGIVGCGSNAIPPALPAPAPNGTLAGYAGNCSAISGTTPFQQNNTPYAGNMYPLGNYGTNGDTIALSLFYSGALQSDNYIHNIVGTSQMNMPDLTAMTPYPTPQTQTNFCVSSSTISGNTPTPGVFNSADLSVQLVLQGIISVPLFSGYSAYPGGFSPSSSNAAMGQELIQVAIGTSGNCPAYIYQGRIVGCIAVSIGPTNSTETVLQYVAQ